MVKPAYKKYINIALLIVIALGLPILFSRDAYILHVIILIMLWGYFATCWSYMGRFGMVSLGHGVFICIGAYGAGLLFLKFAVSPIIGMILGAIAAGAFGALLGYIAYRVKLAGHYFAIVTLAVGALSYHVIVYFRKATGGSLGRSIPRVGFQPWNLQFAGNRLWWYFVILAFLLIALFLWKKLDDSKFKLALVAIRDNETAASTLGVNTIKIKVYVTALSALMTSIGGTLYGQYMLLLNPEVMAGVDISLHVPFKALLGGMNYLFGPVIGSIIMVVIEEYVRVAYGVKMLAYSDIAYAIVIVLLIIYSPKGVMGLAEKLYLRGSSAQREVTQVLELNNNKAAESSE